MSGVPRGPEAVLFFVHIPKTAGMTLVRILERQYGPESVFFLDNDRLAESGRELESLSRTGTRPLRVVRGHVPFGSHRFVARPVTHVTLLRDPVARVVSHYRYVLRTPGHFLREAVVSRSISLEDYADSGLSCELDNGQTRLLSGAADSVPFGRCGEELLAAAKQNLREHFAVAGPTERFDETLCLLKRRLGWTYCSYAPENVAPEPGEGPSPAARAAIEARNRLDLALYREVVARFDERIAGEGAGFAEELAQLRRLNEAFRPEPGAMRGWRGWLTRLGLRT